MKRSHTSILLLAMGAMLYSPPVAAQTLEWNPESLELTREDLNDLVARLEAVVASSAYSSEIRDQARGNLERIEQRLSGGDFRIGDAVILEVEAEPQLSDTLRVQPGPVIRPAEIGPISLEGVLRSELVPYLSHEIGRYVRDPVVRARSMIRISVQGAVSSPGYYLFPAEELLSEALMRAGGPEGEAEINEMRIERAQRIVWGGPRLQEEIAAGRTLDQLGLLAGDQIYVPTLEADPGWLSRSAMIIGVAGSIVTSWALLR